MTANVLLDIQNLKTYFHTDGQTVRAVDDVSLQIREGQTLGLVGESGSGKSVTSFTIMRLLPDVSAKIEGGSISFLGRDLVKLRKSEMPEIRGRDVSMIFQEPGTSLNPVFRVGWQVMEAIKLHENVTDDEARARTIKLFEEVGIPNPSQRIDSYPHEMSGGQKQRVMIAMALSCNPKLLIADEPTTALDVTIQAQILDLIRKLRDTRGMSILFITHDLGVIAEIADEVAIMFRGKIVERGPVLDIFQNPKHPYTKGLLACRPRLSTPYRLLPTVADFMDVKDDGAGGVTITEKPLDDARMRQFATAGRGRLLHPAPVLERLGHPFDATKLPAGAAPLPNNAAPLLTVEDLCVYYPVKKGVFSRVVDHIKAVDGISFGVYRGQTLGLVGESGCGKTTTGRAIVRLIPITSGHVTFDGQPLSDLRGRALRDVRKRIQIIFQDPYASLNPRLTVESMLTEPMAVHGLVKTARERRDRAAALLHEVGLQAQHLGRYPHEFSGGQRQRLCIARALAVEPEFLICDESVSALDVSVQAQVLNLLKRLQQDRGLTYIFISHDLSVVKFMSDMMAVMNQGKFAEFGPSDLIYADPKDAYTQRLISAIPSDSLDKIRERQRAREEARRKRTGGDSAARPASS